MIDPLTVYNFTDDLGHPIRMCTAYVDLLIELERLRVLESDKDSHGQYTTAALIPPPAKEDPAWDRLREENRILDNENATLRRKVEHLKQAVLAIKLATEVAQVLPGPSGLDLQLW